MSAAITAHVSFHYDFHILGRDYYEFEYWVAVNASASIKFEILGVFSTTQTLISTELPIMAGLSIYFELKMTFSASASFTAEGSLIFTMKQGARTSSVSGQRSISQEPKLEYKVKVDGDFQIDIIPEVIAGFRILAVFIVDFDVTFDFMVKGTLFVHTLTNGDSDNKKRHLCTACIEGGMSITINGNLSVKFGLNREKAIDIINLNNLLHMTIELGNFYASLYEGKLRFGWGACPNYEGNPAQDIWGDGSGSQVILNQGTCGENLTWVLYDDYRLVISGTGDMYNYSNWMKDSPWHNYSVKKVIIEEGVTSIGDSAFDLNRTIESVVIPDSVKTIGYCAFLDCRSMTRLIMGNGVESLGSNAFDSCSGLTTVTLSDSLTSISAYAFYKCSSLKSIVIPVSVTGLGREAFRYCNNIETVYYMGTEAQWLAVDKGFFNGSLINATIICADTPMPTIFSSLSVIYALNENTEMHESAIIGNSYIMLIVKDANAEDLLDCKNLLYIDQKTAESETLTFEFELKEDYPDYDVIFSGAYIEEEAVPLTTPHEHACTEIVSKVATCAEEGEIVFLCEGCGYSKTQVISTTDHTDKNRDGVCDSCGEDLTKDCKHICHSSNAFIQFVYKLVCFLWRLFGMDTNRYCVCGKAHW